MIGTPVLAQGTVNPSGNYIKLNVPLGDMKDLNLSAGEPLYWYLSVWYGFIIGSVGILATVMIMWGGFKWLTSRGNATTISAAKETIWSAIIGLVLAFLSYTILYLINPALIVIKTPALTADFSSFTGGQTSGTQTATAGGAVPLNQISGEAINSNKLPVRGEYNPTLRERFGGSGLESLAQRREIGGNTYVGGASSNFGGPDDTEGGTAFISGEAFSSLRPDSDYYMAYRFDYTLTSPEDLRNMWAIIVNPDTGRAVRARIIDWGPNPNTGRSIDVSRAVQRDLGVNDGGNLYFRLIRR